MTWRFVTTVAVLSATVMFFFGPRWSASSFQAADKDYSARVDTTTGQLSDAVEHLQADIVEELSGAKEKQLFQKADQLLHELVKMEKLLRKSAVSRDDLYKQFDSIDGKVAVLGKAVSELTAKPPVVVRGAERIRTLTDALHYIVSNGDSSTDRRRQVLIRQANAMSDATKKLSRTAGYALGAAPGRGELLGDMQKLAEACAKFATVAATPASLEKHRKEFTTLNDAWRQVVQGISLLPPTENVYLLREGLRADAIHERLFRALEIKGERVSLTIRI